MNNFLKFDMSRLYEFRCKYGKTQIQIAKSTGLTKATIGRIERGEAKNLKAVTIFKLNEYFKNLGET